MNLAELAQLGINRLFEPALVGELAAENDYFVWEGLTLVAILDELDEVGRGDGVMIEHVLREKAEVLVDVFVGVAD